MTDEVARQHRARPRQHAELIYKRAFANDDRQALRWLAQNDRYFLLTCLLNRSDCVNDWVFARCREVEDDPDGHIDLWSRGHFKALANDVPVPTPTGWRAHGDLSPGDAVFGPDGAVCQVVAVNGIITDGDCYELEFDDGAKIKANGDHLWSVERRTRKRIPLSYNKIGPKRIYRETVILNTRTIATHDHKQDNRLAIRVNEPLELPPAQLPIDPYVLGAWLGDGNTNAGRLTCSKDDFPHFRAEFEKAGHVVRVVSERANSVAYAIDPRDRRRFCTRGHDRDVVGIYRGQCKECRRQWARKKITGMPMEPVAIDTFAWRLRNLALLGDPAGRKKGYHKHIPAIYLRGSIEQRLALLQGAMDTDGTCDQRGTATFVNINDDLVDGFCELAMSLGLKPHRRLHHGKIKGTLYPFWQVSFQAYKEFPPFRLSRKISRCINGQRKKPRRFIISCRKIPMVPMRCIQVDSPDGLYLVSRNMITTHNSSVITFAGNIQDILKDPEITICIFAHVASIAKAFLRQIKHELETNKLLKKLFDDILWQHPDRQAPRWGEDSGLVVKRLSNPPAATIMASGLVDGMPTGMHFLKRVYDDVVTDKSVTTPDMIHKTTDAFDLSSYLGPVTGEGRVQIVGTRYHHSDTYGDLLRRGKWKERRHPATHNGKFDGTPVFLSRSQWEEELKKPKSVVAAQMLLNPLEGAETKFDVRLLQFWEVRAKRINVYITCDPSKGPQATSDSTAIVVTGVDIAGNKYLLDGWCHRMQLSKRWQVLRDCWKRWSRMNGVGVVQVGYEQFGVQNDLPFFEDRMRQESIAFPILELMWPRSGRRSKEHRIERLEPDIRMGRWRLPRVIQIDGEGNSRPYDPSTTKAAQDAIAAGEKWRVAAPIHKIDEDGKLYDFMSKFLDEFIFFPVSRSDDILDAASRIYDMDPQPPLHYDDEPGHENSIEPQSYIDGV